MKSRSMKRTTLEEIAEYANVSKATVSYVLNNTKPISEETRKKVLDAAEKLHYVKNYSAASLTNHKSYLIGVVIPQTAPGTKMLLASSFYSELVASIEWRARQKGYHLFISGQNLNKSYSDFIMERNLDGVIAVGIDPDELHRTFKGTDAPVVLIDSYGMDDEYPNIRIDDKGSMYRITKYVIGMGHRSIGMICGRTEMDGVEKRRVQGYLKALAEAGIPENSDVIIHDDNTMEAGYRAARTIAEKHKELTAVVTTADIIAIGAMKGFQECGIRVPEDISLTGFDNLQITGFLNPGLTTVMQDIERRGDEAVECLTRCMEGRMTSYKPIIMPTELVIRDSVKKL